MFETTIKVYHSLQSFCRAAPMEGLDRFLRIIRRFSLSVPRAASAKILTTAATSRCPKFTALTMALYRGIFSKPVCLSAAEEFNRNQPASVTKFGLMVGQIELGKQLTVK